MNLKLNLDLKNILPILLRAEPYVFGLVLVGVFGYTAWSINAALNVKPAAAAPTAKGAAAPAKITFDKSAIEAVKSLDVVGGDVPTGDLGKDDPFK